MSLSAAELSIMRDTTEQLLTALGLKTYLFEVEPREEAWAVKVECAGDAGWETAVLPLPREQALASRADAAAQAALLAQWRERLRGCCVER